jgi:hypothetical protein
MKPSTTATVSETIVSARASRAPFQYGSEVSASQKSSVSKLKSSGYFTSTGGMLYLAASLPIVPFRFSVAIAALSCAPSAESDGR